VIHNPKGPTLDPLPSADRASVISSMVSEIFTDLSGVRIEPSNASATFLEMGFDSLFLTQVTQHCRANRSKVTSVNFWATNHRSNRSQNSSIASCPLTLSLQRKCPPALTACLRPRPTLQPVRLSR